MRIMVLGLRGFPGVQGGVETHAEHLYQRLSTLGCEVEVLVRAPYWQAAAAQALPAIRFQPLWSPTRSGLEALAHSLLGVTYAALHRPDVLHIHAIGPALVTPLARLLGLRVVVTHHGPDYDREKWSAGARAILRLGERWGMRHAHARIAISAVIQALIARRHDRPSVCIPNGVELPAAQPPGPALAAFGLAPGRYVLNVSRLVPEKRQLDLIDAFQAAALPGWRLALVGGLPSDDDYVARVRAAAAAAGPAVVLTGFQQGRALAELFANAGLFVLPSTHEGLPIALLEALSHGLPCLASDIPANRAVGLPAAHYFATGDRTQLSAGLQRLARRPQDSAERTRLRAWVSQNFDWQRIARQTLGVYRQAARQALPTRLQRAWLPD